MVYSTRASAARPTFRVLVRAMGVSRVPSSSTWTRPQVLPNPLCTYPAATNLRSNTFPGPGTITVTPVLLSPLLTVLWPTSTPGTSVILFLGPVFMTPGTMPKSLILFLSIFFPPPTASGLHVDYIIMYSNIIIEEKPAETPLNWRPCGLSPIVLGRRDSNPRVQESKSCALPLGDGPTSHIVIRHAKL